MSAEDVFKHILSWVAEDSHRGQLARAFQSNMGDSPELQAKRVGLLSIYLEREAHSKRGLSLV
ncbi:hypothetical protein TPA0910_15550 [Streptomyces hygroscopicus subsp. sporocinereus]|uniref:Uncharacterized protein n=1 Tax=Streptomyces hygroscopicus TaxID=1912 RepID=A0ABQ3TUU6_STRHY|nr:hypothetical protein [Streptomyces hygroscopicus]GHJ27122.1 hypothetical protein TPA0910_15550 [Streptomyces hygroscopicus]